MSKNKLIGDRGELDVVKRITCPNCNSKLMVLPPSFPLYDVQCVACYFRAQVKTNNCKPKKEIFGATWEIMNKVYKAGFMTPPLIANFIWKEKEKRHQEIRFYPFIPRTHLKKRFTTIKKSGRQLWMFNYINLDQIPSSELYRKEVK